MLNKQDKVSEPFKDLVSNLQLLSRNLEGSIKALKDIIKVGEERQKECEARYTKNEQAVFDAIVKEAGTSVCVNFIDDVDDLMPPDCPMGFIDVDGIVPVVFLTLPDNLAKKAFDQAREANYFIGTHCSLKVLPNASLVTLILPITTIACLEEQYMNGWVPTRFHPIIEAFMNIEEAAYLFEEEGPDALDLEEVE